MEAQMRTIAEPATQSDGVQRADRATRNVSLASVGAVLIALKVISCPLVLILLSLGVGTAWLGELSAPAYQPIFYALAAAMLGYGYYFVYGKTRKTRAKGGASVPASPNRMAKLSLWGATGLVAAAVALNYLGPALLFDIY